MCEMHKKCIWWREVYQGVAVNKGGGQGVGSRPLGAPASMHPTEPHNNFQSRRPTCQHTARPSPLASSRPNVASSLTRPPLASSSFSIPSHPAQRSVDGLSFFIVVFAVVCLAQWCLDHSSNTGVELLRRDGRDKAEQQRRDMRFREHRQRQASQGVIWRNLLHVPAVPQGRRWPAGASSGKKEIKSSSYRVVIGCKIFSATTRSWRSLPQAASRVVR